MKDDAPTTRRWYDNMLPTSGWDRYSRLPLAAKIGGWLGVLCCAATLGLAFVRLATVPAADDPARPAYIVKLLIVYGEIWGAALLVFVGTALGVSVSSRRDAQAWHAIIPSGAVLLSPFVAFLAIRVLSAVVGAFELMPR